MTPESKPTLSKGVRLREEEGHATLQIPEGQIKMSGAGLQIIKLCDGHSTLAQILVTLKERYPAAVHEKIESDTINFLNRLNERAVVQFL